MNQTHSMYKSKDIVSQSYTYFVTYILDPALNGPVMVGKEINRDTATHESMSSGQECMPSEMN